MSDEIKFEIVCVDDEKDILEFTVEQINDLGYTAVPFPNATLAIDYIKEHSKKIILIISDLRMDNVNGFDFRKSINNFAADIPFVVITGYWNKEMSANAMEIGIKAFIEKPVTQKSLVDIVHKFSDERLELLSDEIEMIRGFLTESEPMLEDIENLILEIEEDPHCEKSLSVYFRLLHTIKGTASCVGLTQLGDYTHKYEDFIGQMREHKIPVCTQSINILLSGLDDLKKYFKETYENCEDTFIDVEGSTKKFDTEQTFASQVEVEESKELEKVVESSTNKKDDEKMTVPMSILNEFMEESGELTVIRNSILKTVKKIENKYRGDDDIDQLNGLLEGMYNVTSNIQDKIQMMRLVSLKNIFRPFKRLVRDLSKQLSKEVEFEIEGEEMLVDTTIAKLFSNTLVHLIRNSLDHGFETKDEREKSQKNPIANLKISIQENGEFIELKIIDDGKGINPDFIRKKAIEKGLYTEDEISKLNELEIINIIFASGFSTAEVVSDLSGRGVGMDMVRGSFEEMGGMVFVQSKVGEGSTFHLNVPVPKSVLIINSLLVESANQNFIFHMEEVAEVIRFEKDSQNTKMYNFANQKLLHHNDESIELIKLDQTLGLQKSSEEKEIHNLVILRIGEMKFGVEVDEIYEFEEVVSRKISQNISSADLYLGASLLGSGDVAMIISAEGVAARAGINVEHEQSKSQMLTFNQGDNVLEQVGYEYMMFQYALDKAPLAIDLEKVERFEKVSNSQVDMSGNNMVIRYMDKPICLIDPAALLGYQSSFSKEEFLNGDSTDLIDIMIVTTSNDVKLGVIVFKLGEIEYTQEEMNVDTIDMDGLEGSLYINGQTICVVNIDDVYEIQKSQYLKIEQDYEEEQFDIAA